MLTTRQVTSAKPDPKGKRRELPDGDRGLYLVVGKSGAKSWVCRYRFDGKPTKFMLGKFPAMTLARARDRARAAMEKIDRGEDPAAEKRQARAKGKPQVSDGTFSAAVQSFMTREGDKLKTAYEVERCFSKYVVPVWGKRPVDAITRKDVVALLDYIEDNHGPVQADRVLGWVRRLFNWCALRGEIDHVPVIRGMARAGVRKRSRFLTDPELALVWDAMTAQPSPYSVLFKVLLLTGQRRGEVGAMRWAEVDLERKEWLLPDTKSGRAHMVPLVDAACDLITTLPRYDESPWAFASYRDPTKHVNGWHNAKRALDGAMTEQIPEWHLHDLRRSFRTACPRLHIPSDIAERCLNHSMGKGIESHYNLYDYVDEKRRALQKWADHLDKITSSAPVDNVVKLTPNQ
jgi:integrase